MGLPVHVAARVSSAAHGGQILLSAASFEALADAWPEGINARSIGAFTLSGIPDPEELYQVTAPDLDVDFPAPRSFATPKPTEP